MQITATEKEKINLVLKAALSQSHLIQSVTIEAADFFNVILDIADEDDISTILNNHDWIEAVPHEQLVHNSNGKANRAEGIVYLFLNNDVRNIKFLDFGTGEGHVAARVAAYEATISVGFDLEESHSWKSFPQSPNLLLTNNFTEVQKHAPYDAVLLYDVLDHCEEPIEVLKEIHTLLSDDGKVYARNHPWCSRHGGHTYHALNKAFAHLFLSDMSVMKLSNNMSPKQKLLYPLEAYNTWFQMAKFKQVSREVVEEQVEDFFKSDPRSSKIKQVWNESPRPELLAEDQFPDHFMNKSFVDFILNK